MSTRGGPKLRIEKTRLCGGGATHPGKVRASNQDVILIDPELGLYAVLDGMGGAQAGDIAARLARETLVGFLREHSGSRTLTPRELLAHAVDAAATAVYTAAEQQAAYRGMGTTVVACLVVEATDVEPMHVVIGHVGDSRAYLLRDGYLRQLTRDHTLVRRFVDEGAMTTDQAETSQLKHILTRNLGATKRAKPDLQEHALEAGDRVLLCSDGLHGGGVSGEEIRGVFRMREAPEQTAHQLIALALRGEARDNISVIVLAWERAVEEGA
jgi:serine/threonine protein phosphatase PrpC